MQGSSIKWLVRRRPPARNPQEVAAKGEVLRLRLFHRSSLKRPIAFQGEAPMGPDHALESVARDSKAVLRDLGFTADIINVSEANREVGLFVVGFPAAHEIL